MTSERDTVDVVELGSVSEDTKGIGGPFLDQDNNPRASVGISDE